ncbi:MAG: exodeoxyribonuclease III [Parvibaculales bacterium]
MRIATWNVNSVKARLPNVLRWLEEEKPDVACLQELKCVDEAFPRAEIEALGYNVETHGQKTYNGVALLSKFPLEDVSRGLPDFEDEQARYIEAVVSDKNLTVRVASLYLPNGNPVEGGTGAKYTYKLDWMAALEAHAKTLLSYEEAFVLAGDYNVIPTPADTHDPVAWDGDALFRPETHAAYRRLLNLGLTEALSSLRDTGDDTYTFWDYQGGARRRNHGIRIDHHLLSPLAADRLESVHIDAHTRDWEKPSDHVPVVMELK